MAELNAEKTKKMITKLMSSFAAGNNKFVSKTNSYIFEKVLKRVLKKI